jgi:SAM-dependent methyltransferase
MSLSLPTLAREVVANLVMVVPPLRAWRVRRGRTTNMCTAADEARLDRQRTAWYLTNLGESRFRGATVVEVGPGDTMPFAAHALRLGAARYVAIDRFADAWREPSDRRITLVPRPIEAVPDELSSVADLVVSFNVLEHVSNVTLAFRQMARLLVPTGVMLHRIDYGPHAHWRQHADPTAFLRVRSSSGARWAVPAATRTGRATNRWSARRGRPG